MTDEKNTAEATEGENDNSFAGGVGDATPGQNDTASDAVSSEATGEENLETRMDEAAADGAEADAAPGAGSEEAADAEHPDTKLAAERLEDLQRLQAEYVNYRNRVEREKVRDKEAHIGSVVEALIPVLDDIEMARQHGDLDGGPMEKIADKIETVLARFGVQAFGEASEPFDPNFHEALMHVEAEAPEGVDGQFVVQVLQKGFKVNDRIVRAARVSVAG